MTEQLQRAPVFETIPTGHICAQTTSRRVLERFLCVQVEKAGQFFNPRSMCEASGTGFEGSGGTTTQGI